MAQKTVVLERNTITGWYGLRMGDGTYESTSFPITRRQGDVLPIVARAHPGAQIGVKSEDIGVNCILAFGPVVWMRPGAYR